MSKTRRRKVFGIGKGKRQYHDGILYDHDWRECIYIPKSEKELIISINEFHSDRGVGDNWRVPSWFRKDKERIVRARMKSETRKILRTGDYYNYNYEPVKRTIQRDWW